MSQKQVNRNRIKMTPVRKEEGIKTATTTTLKRH
jgi:hypothetical protein